MDNVNNVNDLTTEQIDEMLDELINQRKALKAERRAEIREAAVFNTVDRPRMAINRLRRAHEARSAEKAAKREARIARQIVSLETKRQERELEKARKEAEKAAEQAAKEAAKQAAAEVISIERDNVEPPM